MLRHILLFYFSLLIVNSFAQSTWNKPYLIIPENSQLGNSIGLLDSLIVIQTMGHCDSKLFSSLGECSGIGIIDLDGNLIESICEYDSYYFDPLSNILVEKNRVISLATGFTFGCLKYGIVSSYDLKTKELLHKPGHSKQGNFYFKNIFKWPNSNKYIIAGQHFSSDGGVGFSILDTFLTITRDTILNRNVYFELMQDIVFDTDSTFTYFIKKCVDRDCKDYYNVKPIAYRVNKDLKVIDSIALNNSIFKSEGKFKILPIENGSYISLLEYIPNSKDQYKPVIYRLDKEFNIVWKTLINVDTNIHEQKYIRDIVQLSNKDIIAVGWKKFDSNSVISYNKAWAVRLSETGRKIWENQYYVNYNSIERTSINSLSFNSVVEDKNGNLYFLGNRSDTLRGKVIIKSKEIICASITKTGSNGIVYNQALDIFPQKNTKELRPYFSVNYLNAFESINLSWDSNIIKSGKVIVKDILEREIKSISIPYGEWNTSIWLKAIDAGVYYITLETEPGSIIYRMIVKE